MCRCSLRRRSKTGRRLGCIYKGFLEHLRDFFDFLIFLWVIRPPFCLDITVAVYVTAGAFVGPVTV